MYEDITNQIRGRVSKLTLQQQKHLNNLYEDAIKGLAKTAKGIRSKSLSNRWVKDYRKELMRVRRELRVGIRKQVKISTRASANLGIKGQQMVMIRMFEAADGIVVPSFTGMFSQVSDNIVKDIISGNLYKDNKTLSSRIWTYDKKFNRDIQYTINQAILEKKSAIDLADDLDQFIKIPAKRDSEWGKAYPNLKNRKADYNAIRLARTSINHAYQTSTVQSSKMNPYVGGIEWISAEIHGRTCQLCIDRANEDSYGLGNGVFPVELLPLDHP